MITLTFTTWQFILFFVALGVLGNLAGKLGNRLGRATYRRWRLHRDGRLTEWSRRG